MTNHTKKKLAPWQFLLLFITSLAIPTILGSLTLTTIPPFSDVSTANASESIASVKQKLIGMWLNIGGGGSLIFSFTRDDKFFSPEDLEDTYIYKIDKLSIPNRYRLRIYSLNNKLEETLEFWFADSTGKKIFLDYKDNTEPYTLAKVSSLTTFAELENFLEPIKNEVGIEEIGNINLAQQAFHLKNGRFSNANITDKGNELGVQPVHKYYQFETYVQDGNAISIATPKASAYNEKGQYELLIFSGMTAYVNGAYKTMICMTPSFNSDFLPRPLSESMPHLFEGKLFCSTGSEVKKGEKIKL